MSGRQSLRAALTLALGYTLGCGYSVVGSKSFFGAHTIVVMPFEEKEPLGLAPDLAQELATLVAGGGATLSLDRTRADGVLSGTIRNVSTGNEPGEKGVPISYKLHVTIDAVLVVHGEERWRTTLSVAENFLPAPAPDDSLPAATQRRLLYAQSLTTEAYRREALVRLAQNTARVLHEQLCVAGGM